MIILSFSLISNEKATSFISPGNDLARCLRWGGGYEGESIPKLLEKLARSDSVMMDRWNISIDTKSDKAENISIPSHKVLKVSMLEPLALCSQASSKKFAFLSSDDAFGKRTKSG